MRIGLLADIHANLPALEAALTSMKRHAPDLIVSLGDQVNLGPCPRETLALLHDSDVRCLHGNHERYVLAAMAGDPDYDGENFESLRFNARLLKAEEITFPKTTEIEGVTFCHAMPEDDRFPINVPEKALLRFRAMSFQEPRRIICGHGHNPTHYSLRNLTLHSIGSTGCMDDGAPGVTNYAILDVVNGEMALRPMTAGYDTRGLHGLFKSGGMADFCPVMARLMCLQMEQNQDFLLRFVDLARSISALKDEARISMETWHEADARFDWPGGETTAAFWRG